MDIENKDCILSSSWLTYNVSLVDTQEHYLRNAISGLAIACSVRWMPSVTVLDLYLETLEHDEILLIINTRERYSRFAKCFSSQRAAGLHEHKPWYQEILLQHPHAKIHTHAVHKTTWEEDEALQADLDENV